MATTTWDTIRDNMIAKLNAITPSVLAQYAFHRAPDVRTTLRKWARRNAMSAVLRQYEIVREGPSRTPSIVHMQQLQRNEDCEIVIAYPVQPSLYGERGLDELERVIRLDARQVVDTVFSQGNYVSGQHAAFVTIDALEKDDENVWFQSFTVSLVYDEAMNFTA
jgi:hypothetical protein